MVLFRSRDCTGAVGPAVDAFNENAAKPEGAVDVVVDAGAVVVVVGAAAGGVVVAPPPRLNKGFGAVVAGVADVVVAPPRLKRGAGAAVAGVADVVVAPPRLNRLGVAAVGAVGVEVVAADEAGVFPPKVGNKGFAGAGVVLDCVPVDAGVAEPRLGNVKPPVLGASVLALAGMAGFAKKLLEEEGAAEGENRDGFGCEVVLC